MRLSLYVVITLIATLKTNHALLAWDHALKGLHNDLTCKWNLSHIHKPIESEVYEIFEPIHKLTHNKKNFKKHTSASISSEENITTNNDIEKSDWLDYPKFNLTTLLLEVRLI